MREARYGVDIEALWRTASGYAPRLSLRRVMRAAYEKTVVAAREEPRYDGVVARHGVTGEVVVPQPQTL